MTPILLKTAGLLVLSNVFMAFGWYAHLKNLSGKPWYVAALISWGIAVPIVYSVHLVNTRLTV